MGEKKKIDIEYQVEMFLEMILPDNASEIQVAETRKAFIAGMIQNYANMEKIASYVNEEDSHEEFDDLVDQLSKLRTKYIKG